MRKSSEEEIKFVSRNTLGRGAIAFVVMLLSFYVWHDNYVRLENARTEQERILEKFERRLEIRRQQDSR
jgi:hypothetical protein